MPKIVVMVDAEDGDSSAIVLSERVAPELLESGHYATQLLERVRWAVQDATQPSAPDRANGARSRGAGRS
jgi:hypothetical protein